MIEPMKFTADHKYFMRHTCPIVSTCVQWFFSSTTLSLSPLLFVFHAGLHTRISQNQRQFLGHPGKGRLARICQERHWVSTQSHHLLTYLLFQPKYYRVFTVNGAQESFFHTVKAIQKLRITDNSFNILMNKNVINQQSEAADSLLLSVPINYIWYCTWNI